MAYTTINKSKEYFNTKLYTGDGSSSRSITGVGFQPDWLWVKERSSSSSHQVADAVRGAYSRLQTDNNNGASVDSSPYNDFKSFDSDGWSMGSGGAINENSQTYAAWNWKAGSSTSSNSDGDVTSTVLVNSTAGFSIVKWTNNGNASWIGHGLGTTPHWILIKSLSGSASSITAWVNYHHKIDNSAPEDYTIYLNNTDGRVDNPVFNDTAPTSTKFRFDSADTTDYIAYCFAEKTGYSKFGKYAGNNRSNGTFVYTGFKPELIMVKRISNNGYDWIMYTNEINGLNPMNDYLAPNSSAAEVQNNANQVLDIVSNGFKHRGTGASTNGSADYIYMAFGQSLVGSNNVPCTAR